MENSKLNIAQHKTFFGNELVNITTKRVFGSYGLTMDITTGDSTQYPNHIWVCTNCNYAMIAFFNATDGKGVHPFSCTFLEEIEINEHQDIWSSMILVPKDKSSLEIIFQLGRQKYDELSNQENADLFRAHYFNALDRIAIISEYNE